MVGSNDDCLEEAEWLWYSCNGSDVKSNNGYTKRDGKKEVGVPMIMIRINKNKNKMKIVSMGVGQLI